MSSPTTLSAQRPRFSACDNEVEKEGEGERVSGSMAERARLPDRDDALHIIDVRALCGVCRQPHVRGKCDGLSRGQCRQKDALLRDEAAVQGGIPRALQPPVDKHLTAAYAAPVPLSEAVQQRRLP